MSKKILIVEDEKTLQMALKDKFESEGFTVVTANDGEEGLAAVTSGSPDIILLDIAMPKMNGIAMMQQLKAQGKTMPVIMLTNLDDSEHVGQAMELGSFDYLIKSNWKMEDIVNVVNKKLNLK